MRRTERLFSFLAALSVIRLYTPRNILFFSAWALGYALTNMILHPIRPIEPVDPLQPAWAKHIEELRYEKRYNEALKLVNQHIKESPNSYDGYMERALIFSAMGNEQASRHDNQLAQAKLDDQIRRAQALCNNQAGYTFTCHLPKP